MVLPESCTNKQQLAAIKAADRKGSPTATSGPLSKA
jgi:hypothetical protein